MHRPYILVGDSVAALCDVAAAYRRMFDIPVIGVTGSVGKTSAKEMIGCVLSRKYFTLKTEGNLNNELGVSYTLLRLRPEHQIAVVEMGVNHFGEMERLAKIARPSAAVYTNIGSSHLEFLGNREGVRRAKSEMLAYMNADAPVFVNGDDDLLSGAALGTNKISFGASEHCDFRIKDIISLGFFRHPLQYRV